MLVSYALKEQRKKFISNLKKITMKTFYFSWGRARSTGLNSINETVTILSTVIVLSKSI
jgi:hypothetical protein